MEKPRILCVDDETDNLDALERLLRARYQILKASSGPIALEILADLIEPLALIITDQRMPEMSGVEFLEQSQRTHPETLRILLTGYTDLESVVAAVNSGQIYRYINKPWDPVDLVATVGQAVERFNLNQELKKKNQELSIALGELQTLDQAKNQFMILINHELKTPLTSLLNFSEMLRETPLSEEQTVCVDRISKSSVRLKELVDDSLLIISSETKTLKLKIQPFDFSNLDFKLKHDIENLQEKKKISIQISKIEKRFIGDSASISQVLRRLIHNGLKFAKEGSQIQVEALVVQSHRVQFSVTNEGPQIPESVMEKIMRPFFLDEDVMKHSTGVGLGLTVCQALLKNQASHLSFENTDTGVQVKFELPCL